MELKDILLQNENSLPTIADTMGPSTSTKANTGTLPTITASSTTYWKFGISSVVGLLGMFYLAAGKKQNDVGKMIIGAGLTLASFFLF